MGKKILVLLVLIVTTCIFFSCESLKELESVQTVDIEGMLVENQNGTLVFESESQLNRALNKLSEQSYTEVGVRLKTKVVSSGQQEFRSLYDVYTSAMEEAESYYDREGGYEAFKEKYASLYFPEEGDDYSAYLPVSDDNRAKIADVNGNVIVGGAIHHLKDVDSYQQLKNLGRIPLEAGDIDVSTLSGINNLLEGEDKDGNGKIWVKTHKKFRTVGGVGNHPVLWVEIGFRKKGALDKWYNYASKTTLLKNTVQNICISTDRMQAASPHTYIFPITTYQQTAGVYYYAPVYGEIEIDQPGVGEKVLSLAVKYAGSLWRPSSL